MRIVKEKGVEILDALETKNWIQYRTSQHWANTEGLHMGYMESHSMEKSANHHKEEAYTYGILRIPADDTCT